MLWSWVMIMHNMVVVGAVMMMMLMRVVRADTRSLWRRAIHDALVCM